MGRGEEMDHGRQAELPRNMELHLGFCFPGDEDGSKVLTILVARERLANMTMASMAPSKSSGPFTAKRIFAFMREIGCEQGDLTVKSDQEPAMQANITEVGRLRAAA